MSNGGSRTKLISHSLPCASNHRKANLFCIGGCHGDIWAKGIRANLYILIAYLWLEKWTPGQLWWSSLSLHNNIKDCGPFHTCWVYTYKREHLCTMFIACLSAMHKCLWILWERFTCIYMPRTLRLQEGRGTLSQGSLVSWVSQSLKLTFVMNAQDIFNS